MLDPWPVWEGGGEHIKDPPWTASQVLLGSVSGLFSELVTLNAFPVFFYNSNSPDTFAQGLWCPGAAQGAKPVGIWTKREQDTNTVRLSVHAGLCGHNPDVTG